MVEFTDILYGSVRLPDWIVPFLKLPEFVRLRGVRLSNVDSYEFKDFSGPSRWEHCVAVAWLALRCADSRRLTERDRIHLALAALLHDVATPPFAHTAEYVLESFDHELESQNLLSNRSDRDFAVDTPVFASQLPQFRIACDQLSKRAGVSIDPDEVARMVVGDGDHGFLIHGTVDLDNADNVTRACRYLGMPVDPTVPPRIAEWLGTLESIPTELAAIAEPALEAWMHYRGELYTRFFRCGDEELGRQAFLQHIMRRALRAGLPRRSLIWNTDERFLFEVERLNDNNKDVLVPSLEEIVQRYRLLESPEKIAHVEIDDHNILKVLSLPQCVAWIEHELSGPYFHPFAMVIRARHARARYRDGLFPPAPGAFLLFKLGGAARDVHLPDWLRDAHRLHANGAITTADLSQRLHPQLVEWTKSRPWEVATAERKANVTENLKSFGNWSFRLSRNDALHPYPGTFVHAIPAGLIVSLGLQGDLVVDPFGGTGQTAVEAVKRGCKVISGDISAIACLAARTRLTYIDARARQRIREIKASDIVGCDPAEVAEFDLQDRWFHKNTLRDLCKIKRYIDRRRNAIIQQFLTASFSAIIASCTGRRGKEHGYFADNTPLEKGMDHPPFQNAVELFLARLDRNLKIVEALYGHFEREGKQASLELSRSTVVRADVRQASVADYGIEKGEVGGIITSPPYLCMADYTLGQRLSYYFMMPDQLDRDFAAEIGKRRQRFQKERALVEYQENVRAFARLTKDMLRPNGYLATVLGEPTAQAFSGPALMTDFDQALEDVGFQHLWDTWRPINWHRNHGYARLKRERVAVHILRK